MVISPDVLSAIITGAGSVASGGLGVFASRNSAYKNFKYSLKLQNAQNKYNTQMFNRQVELANTAHQREIADLRAAGLNPILSATGGAGASSPTAAASGSATFDGFDDLSAINSAIQNSQAWKNLKIQDKNADTEAKNADTAVGRLKFDKESFDKNYELQQKIADSNILIGMINAEANRTSAVASAIQAQTQKDSNIVLNIKEWAKKHPALAKAAIFAVGAGKYGSGIIHSAKSVKGMIQSMSAAKQLKLF